MGARAVAVVPISGGRSPYERTAAEGHGPVAGATIEQSMRAGPAKVHVASLPDARLCIAVSY